MIVEFFGAPGAGKTTLARALAARLRSRGWRVAVVPRDRPTGFLATLRRFGWFVAVLLDLARSLIRNRSEAANILHLMKDIPPKTAIWKLRLGLYMIRLSNLRRDLAPLNDIVIFDQGFLQAVCSLSLLSISSSASNIVRSLNRMKSIDLSVFIDTSEEVLRDRLVMRQKTQVFLEKYLEFDVQFNVKSIRLFHDIYQMLQERGDMVTFVSSVNQKSLHAAVETLQEQIHSATIAALSRGPTAASPMPRPSP